MEKFKTLESPSGSPSKPPTPSPSAYSGSSKGKGKAPPVTNKTIVEIPEPIQMPKEPDYTAPKPAAVDTSKATPDSNYGGLSPFKRSRQLIIDREKVRAPFRLSILIFFSRSVFGGLTPPRLSGRCRSGGHPRNVREVRAQPGRVQHQRGPLREEGRAVHPRRSRQEEVL